MSSVFNSVSIPPQPFYQWRQDTLILFCHLQPKASANEFAGAYNNRLKIRIMAPPVDGKANSHLLKFIAKQFGVAKSSVSISSGDLGRHKTLHIQQPVKLPSTLAINRP